MPSRDRFHWRDVHIERTGDRLVIENDLLCRTFRLVTGFPSTQSLVYKPTGFEVAAPKETGDFTVAGYNLPWHADRRTDFATVSFRIRRRTASALHPAHAEVRIHLYDRVQQLDLVREYTIQPGQPFLSCRTRVRCAVHPRLYWTPRADLDGNRGVAEFPARPEELRECCIDSLCLRNEPSDCRAVEFFGRTDYENRVVEEHPLAPGSGAVRAHGNLLFCGFEGHGLVWIQDAPPSTERRDPEPYDFRIAGRTVHSCGSGVAPHEVRGRAFRASYVHTLCLHTGGADEADHALKACMRRRFPERPERDYRFVVNPWGGGRFIEKISEPFLREEIRSAAALGADAYQIDDGWQDGGTLADLVVHNQAAGPDFWRISRKHFRGSFRGLARTARESGTELALWIAPSANRDYADWKQFADIVLSFHRTYGISWFKFDGIQVRTKRAEENLERLLRALRLASGGNIVVNFDTTNGQRPGYWLFLEYGNVFLENRYVDKFWGVGYHPETVLRNFWRLARYVRPQKLQIEFADPGIILRDFYRRKAMSMPDLYPPDYWAAVALFANPLGWFNPSALAPEVAALYREVMALHRQIREDLFAGEIHPVGREPNGARIAGFQSYREETRSGYLLLFRERKAPAKARISLRLTDDAPLRFEDVRTPGRVTVWKPGTRTFPATLPSPASWRLYRYGPDPGR